MKENVTYRHETQITNTRCYEPIHHVAQTLKSPNVPRLCRRSGSCIEQTDWAIARN